MLVILGEALVMVSPTGDAAAVMARKVWTCQDVIATGLAGGCEDRLSVGVRMWRRSYECDLLVLYATGAGS